MQIVLAIVMFIYVLAPFLIFRSTSNINIKNLPFQIFSYVFGSLYLLKYKENWNVSMSSTINFVILIVVGITLYLIFYYFSFKTFSRRIFNNIDYYISKFDSLAILRRISLLFVIIGYSLLAFSFIKMGFIPILEKSIEAKYMTGIYRDSYLLVAKYFRISLIIVPEFSVIYAITTLADDGKNKVVKSFIVCCLSFLVLALTNRRGIAGLILVEYLFILILYTSKRKAKYIFVAIIWMFTISGILYNPISLYFKIGQPIDIYSIIYNSVPDISDNLLFYSKLVEKGIYSYGRTIFGGLIPYKYPWNLANYTLIIASGSSDVASGGLRLLLPIHAYSFFRIWLFPIPLFIWGVIDGFLISVNQKLIKYNRREKLIAYMFLNFGLMFLKDILSWNLESLITCILFYFSIFACNYIKKYKLANNQP